MGEYSVWLLEYARTPDFPTAGLVYGAHNTGTRDLPYTFFVLQSTDHLVVVDTGYEDSDFTRNAAEVWGIESWSAPEQLLSRIGFDAEDVDTVILTHHHFDHASNLGAFPNATVYIQRRDVDSYLRKLATPRRMSWLATGLDPNTAGALASVAKAGRLRLLDGPGRHS